MAAAQIQRVAKAKGPRAIAAKKYGKPALECHEEGNRHSEFNRIKRSNAAKRVTGMANDCHKRVVANRIASYHNH